MNPYRIPDMVFSFNICGMRDMGFINRFFLRYNYVCTLSSGHKGNHEAYGLGEKPIRVWSRNKDEVVYNFEALNKV